MVQFFIKGIEKTARQEDRDDGIDGAEAHICKLGEHIDLLLPERLLEVLQLEEKQRLLDLLQ